MGSSLLFLSYLRQGVYICYSRVPENRVSKMGCGIKGGKMGLGLGLESEGEKGSSSRSREVEEKGGSRLNESMVELGARSRRNGGIYQRRICDCQ